MNRRLTMSLTVGLAALTLSACGGGSADSTTDDTDAAVTVPPTGGSEPQNPSMETDSPEQVDAEVGGDAHGDADATDPAATTATTANTATDTTTASSNAALDGFASIDGLTAPITAYGDRPVFAWDPVDGATRYDLWVLNADGTMYWAWYGPETTIPLGGLPLLTPEAEGPDIAEGMRWTVSATDADGALIAFGSTDFALAQP